MSPLPNADVARARLNRIAAERAGVRGPFEMSKTLPGFVLELVMDPDTREPATLVHSSHTGCTGVHTTYDLVHQHRNMLDCAVNCCGMLAIVVIVIV